MLASPPVLCIPVLGKPFVVRMDVSDTHIGACAWAVWSTGCIFFMQVVSHGVQLPMVTDHKLLAIFLSISEVALLPAWGRVNSGLYRSQSSGASVYPATVEPPPLDMLGGEASWVPPGHTVHPWPCQRCCWWTLCNHLLLPSCSLSLILPCISLWLTGWHWLLCMQIWISASLLVYPHF